MKRRLLDRLSTGSIDLGEARNFLCGQYAPHDERARAETLISVAGGTRKWLGDWPEVAVVQPTGKPRSSSVSNGEAEMISPKESTWKLESMVSINVGVH